MKRFKYTLLMFLLIYALLGFLHVLLIRIRWDETATAQDRFREYIRIAVLEGVPGKLFYTIVIVCIVYLITCIIRKYGVNSG